MGEALLETNDERNPERDCSITGSAGSRCSVTSKMKDTAQKWPGTWGGFPRVAQFMNFQLAMQKSSKLPHDLWSAI